MMVRLNSLRNKVSLYLLLLISCAAAISYGVSTTVLSANTRILNEHNRQAALDRAQLYIESCKSLMISTRLCRMARLHSLYPWQLAHLSRRELQRGNTG